MATICDTCHSGCCRAFILQITAYDAFLISRDIGLPLSEFITILSVSPEAFANTIAFSDPGMEDQRFVLTLKRVESTITPSTKKCYFLQEWQRGQVMEHRGNHPGARIIGRCGIYGSRPLMCQVYPSGFDGTGTFGYVVSPTNENPSHEIYTVCPEPWSATTFAKEPASALHSLALYGYEKNFFDHAVAEWNRSPGPISEFIAFMSKAYESRFRLGASVT